MLAESSLQASDFYRRYVIIGGGLFGCHIAAQLLASKQATLNEIAIIDPEEHLLAAWQRNTQNLHMPFLRSSSVHHLHPDPKDLRRFAKEYERLYPDHTLFTRPYMRPSLSLFDAHCQKVIREFNLDICHYRGRLSAMKRQDIVGRDDFKRWRLDIKTTHGNNDLGSSIQIYASDLILALGFGERKKTLSLSYSDSTDHSGKNEQSAPHVQHVFDDNPLMLPPSPASIVVVGAGISGAHFCLSLVEKGYRVHLVSRHKIKESQYDADPGWIGPKFMRSFSNFGVTERMELLVNSRRPGSMPSELYKKLMKMIDEGKIEFYLDSPSGLKPGVLQTINHDIFCESVILTTGFESYEKGPLFEIQDPYFPIWKWPLEPSYDLELSPHLWVTGALADLQIGPIARNIVGARRAGERIISALKSKERPR